MKANELMIGDWVLCDNTPYQIAEIGGMVCLSFEQELFAALEDIEPIPLTAEILEKNGWKLISNTRLKLEYSWSTGAIEEYADIHISVGKDHSNVWRWDFPILNIHLYRGDIELTKFRYVHELQHALRLCGISKEIFI